MANTLTKVQTETTWNVEYNGLHYTVIHLEDADFMSGHTNWEIFEEPEEENDEDIAILDEVLKSEIIEFCIENQ